MTNLNLSLYNNLQRALNSSNLKKDDVKKEETKAKAEETKQEQKPVVEEKNVEPEKALTASNQAGLQNMLLVMLKNNLKPADAPKSSQPQKEEVKPQEQPKTEDKKDTTNNQTEILRLNQLLKDLQTAHANEIAKKDETIAKLQSDDDTDKKAISDGQAEISKLNQLLLNLQTTHANEIAQKDKTIADLKSDDDADKKAIADGQAEISKLNQILLNLQTTHAEEVAQKDKKIAELQSDDDADKKAIADGKSEIERLNEELSKAQSDDESDKKAIQDKQNEIEAKQAEIDRLKAQLANTTNPEEVTRLQGLLDAAINEQTKLNNEKAKLESDLEAANSTIESKTAEIAQKDTQIADLERQLSNAKTPEEVTKLQSELETANSEKAKMQSELDKANADKQALQAQLDAANSEIKDKTDEIAKKDKTIADLKSDDDADKKAIADGQAEIDRLNEELAKAQSDDESDKKAIADKQAEIDSLKAQLAEAEAKLKEAEEARQSEEARQAQILAQVNKFLGTNLTDNNSVITTDSNNKITNIKQYNQETKELENNIDLYYDGSDNVALYIQNDIKSDSTTFNGIVNKDGVINYTPYSEEYLSQINSCKYPQLTQTLEAATIKLTNTISDDNFKDFTFMENLTEDDAKYDLYQKESNVTIDNMNCKVIEYKSTMYSLSGEVQKTLYYKEVYDENWTKLSELAELYDSNNNLIGAKSEVNYNENGIALTKQIQYEKINDELKSSTTVAWNPADENANMAGEGGFIGLKPIKLIRDDDTPVGKTEQKINELKEQLDVKKQEQTDILDEEADLRQQIEELEDELWDLEMELSIAYCESFSDITKTVRPYKEVLADVEAKEAELDALNEQLDDLYDQYNSLDSEIDNLEKQISDYNDPKTARDYKIDDFNQGEIGDCTLLSKLKQMGDIEDMDIVKWNDDGSVDVKLHEIKNYTKALNSMSGKPIDLEIGEQKTIHINAEDLAKDTVNINGRDYKLSQGDLTVRAVERAAMELHDYTGYANSHITNAMLTGQPGYLYKAGVYDKTALENADTASLMGKDSGADEYYLEIFGRSTDFDGNITIKDKDGNDVKIFGKHEYRISYDKNTDSVTVENPHDTLNKDIILDSKTFMKTFDVHTSEQQITTKILWNGFKSNFKGIIDSVF